MDNKEITVNSEAIEETAEAAATVTEELVNAMDSESTAKLAVAFGAGVLATIFAGKCALPFAKRKVSEYFRKKYVTFAPAEEAAQTEDVENKVEPPTEEQEKTEKSDKDKPKKK